MGSRSARRLRLALFAAAAALAVSTAAAAYEASGRDRLVQKLAGQARSASSSPLEQLKYANAWTFRSLALEPLPRDDVETALSQLAGACSPRDLVLSAAARELGLPARRVNFLNIPIHLGHTATEVFIDGSWRFFDATFGIYFAAPDAPATPLSIAEARRRYPDVLVRVADTKGYAGTWSNAEAFAYRDGSLGLVTYRGRPFGDVDRTYFLSEVSVLGTGQEHVETVHLPVGEVQRHRVGKLDGEWRELQDRAADLGYGPAYVPAYFAYWGVVNREYEIVKRLNAISTRPGRLTLKLTFVSRPAAYLVDLEHARRQAWTFSHAATRVRVRRSGRSIVVSAAVVPPLTSISLKRLDPSGFDMLDALEWSFTRSE